MNDQMPPEAESAESNSPQPRRLVFSLRSMIFGTALIAWILGVNNWMGAPYGWLTAIPLSIALPVFIVDPRTFGGALLGFVFMALIGDFFLIGWPKGSDKYFLSMITLGAYGVAGGAALQAIFSRRYILGGIVLVAAIVALAIVLQM